MNAPPFDDLHGLHFELSVGSDGAQRAYARVAPLADATTYRLLIEHLPAITYIAALDAHSSTLYTSPQIATILGFLQAEWMADPTRWLKQIHPDDREAVLKELARVQAGGAPNSCEYRMLTRNGDVRW